MEEAQAILEKTPFHYIFFDLYHFDKMLRDNLFEIKYHPKQINCLMVAIVESLDIIPLQSLFDAGIDDFIRKPLHPDLINFTMKLLDRRKELQLSKRLAEEKLATVFDRSLDVIIIIDIATGKILKVNQAVEGLGYTPGELDYQSYEMLFPFKRIPESRYFLRHVDAKGCSFLNIPFNRANREICYVDINATLTPWETGKAIMLELRDVTERKKMEEEHLKLVKLESVGVLAGGIAHDFNNILTSIVGNLHLLELESKQNEKMLNPIDEIKTACKRAKRLSSQLLTFSKGGSPIIRQSFLDSLLKETTAFALTGSKSAPVYQIQENLWPVYMDEDQIGQVIQNIVQNANDAMPKGGLISISADNFTLEEESPLLPLKAGRYVRVMIKDEGIGMPPEVLSSIFDPYFTTRSNKQGLGLATVYSIIHRHLGYIYAESQLGKGTTIYFYLPANEQQKETLTPSSAKTMEPNKNTARILLIDDEASIRKMAEQILCALGYQSISVRDGQEAVKAYQEAQDKGQPFDLLITDLTVPGGMGGKDLIKELIKINPKVKSIVMSGYSNDPVMSAHRDYGFMGVLEKPFKIKTLSQAIITVLNENEQPAKLS
jgi:PAS domain S-box-containing protein